MLSNIAIGALLILLTTAVHAGGMALSFRFIHNHATIAGSRLHLNRVVKVGGTFGFQKAASDDLTLW